MSASWDSDLSSIIEKTNNNLKLLRKIGDKPQVRSPDVSVTAAGHPSARPRAFVGAQDDAGSTSSRGSARPRAFIRGDDDTSSMGSHGSARPKAYVRGDDDTGSMSSHTSARPKAFIRTDDDSGSVSSRASARPKAFIRPDDDAGSASSRASARPKAFIRADDDSGSVSSRASARPKAFIRGDDDTGSMSSRSSARPKAFVRGDDDTGSMNSNQGLGRSRLDSGSSSGRPHVGIAGGGGLTAAMLQQHRATAAGGSGLGMADLGAHRSRFDLDETRSMSGVSASRLSRQLGANGRVPHARPLGASMGPRIRVPDADIPSDIPNHVVDEIKKSLETHFASRNGAVDKKVADLRTDVAGLTTQTSSLSSQISELRDAVLVSANSNSSSANAPAISDPKIFASVQANAAAIARLEEHSADLLGRTVSMDRELAELGSRVKSLSSATMKISTLEDNIEALVANRQKQEQGLFKLADRVQLMHRQMGSLVDMKAVENLLSIRLTREFREMEDRLAQNVIRMAEKMEQKVQSMEKQSFSQRQESLAALKNDLNDDIQRLQSSALRKSDLLPLQNAQTQSKEDLAQLSNALDRQEKKLQDAKLASSSLRDELADARAELNKALQSQQRSASAFMEEKLEQIATKSKEKSSKFDDQLSELAKKQKKLEEATKTLQETMTQVKAEAGQRWSRSSADREEENDKLRQRLARSVAELEALAATKTEVERRFASEEQQFQARLKELRTTLTETEKQKEAQRLELVQKLQEESKLMGVAQGKNSLLETLLAREKAENEEKNELVRKSKKEVAEVREQIRSLESDKEKKVRQLTSELQAKQTQVGLLTKTLKRIETASAKMLDLSKREAKTVRRVKATKEHELFIAQLKLKEMERVAQALQNGDEMKKQAALTAASTEERKELEKLLLESQLEKDELKQELEEMAEEFNAAKESQKVIMEDTITKLSSDYEDKISELKQQIADKEQAMRQLRDTLVEKSNLDALEDELAALKDEKNDLLEQIQRAQIEHERVTLKTETNLRLEHATEFAAMKSKFEERISELEGAKSELETTKTTIAELETELKEQEALHQREVATLTDEIKEARSKIDECTAQILELEETKTHLEGEVSQMEANIGGASAEKEEELEAIKSQMQAEVDTLRAELAEVSSTMEDKQTQLKEAKQSDEANRQRLVEMAMAQEEVQSRYVAQIDSLTLKLNQERESSRAREQDLEDTIDKLNADVKTLKAESSKELEAARLELADQMTELTTTLKASQHREQQLQSRLKRILEELVQAANASGENEAAEDAEMSDDEAITHHLDTLYATHRRTAHELERLQAEYELTVKQAAADSATAQELDSLVKEHETQIKELESVVEQLRGELKEQYHKSAVMAKGSDEFSEEMASLREEKRQLERQLMEEEKDREKREVSYQRRTEMKEREVEELRNENKTLTAAIAAVREKIRAVESVKFNDLGELQSKLKDLEERTAALQPDEKNVANLEQDFTATRQEIVTLTAEVQSLYQKLTACCGIMEWSELRASVFDEEEKLTRVRSENARELAKVQSVEQEVLTNAEFLNALLVAHGSTGGDGDLLNDFRWMQKYASIAPEIVEKLRKVETRLRDAVLDGLPSLFSKASESVTRPPNSQKSAVDGAAIALALEKAREDYFSETSDGADEDMMLDVDQPDVEQEGLVDEEGEGASHETVDVEDQGSIGAMSHEESGTCADDLVVAEYVVHDEQGRSREERLNEELSVRSRQDRIEDDDVDGLELRKIEETTKVQSEVNFRGDGEDNDLDEVGRLVLERSSKQVKPHIDNECDDSDEFATTIVHAETDEQSAAVDDEFDSNPDIIEQAELSDDERSDELDPLDNSSFDNAMISALESRESHSALEVSSRMTYEEQADNSDSEGYLVQDAVAESSFEESMVVVSENDDKSRDTHVASRIIEREIDRVEQSADVLKDSTTTYRDAKAEECDEASELEESVTMENSVEERTLEGSARDEEDHASDELSTMRRAATSTVSGDHAQDIEVSTASLRSTSQCDEGNTLNVTGTRVAKANLEPLDEAALQMVSDLAVGSLHTNALEHSTARDSLADQTQTLGESVKDDVSVEPHDGGAANAAIAHEDDEESYLDESSLSLASGSPTPARVSSRHAYGDPQAVQGDDGTHSDRLNPLESSFNTDMQSDVDDEASLSYEAEQSKQPTKHQADEDEWHEEQLRAAEHALDRLPQPNSNHDTDDDNVESGPAMALRMEDDESSEEETMTVQPQSTLSASLNRLNMGVHRLDLEEEDEIDGIGQTMPGRFYRLAPTEDDDEFGESSLQSQDDDDVGEDSIHSRDNEFEVVSAATCRPWDNEFDEQSVDDKESLAGVERSTHADEFEEDSRSKVLPSTALLEESTTSLKNSETAHLHEDNELEQSAASVASDVYAEDLEEATSSLRNMIQRDEECELNISLVRVDQADIEQLDASHSFDESPSNLDSDMTADDLNIYASNTLEESTSSVVSGAKAEQQHQDHPLEESDTRSALERSTPGMDSIAVELEGGDGSVLEESSSSLASGSRGSNSPDRVSSRRTHDELQSDNDYMHVDRNAVVNPRPDPLESSFDADMQSDLDDETSASYDAEISTQRIKLRDEDEDEWREEKLREEHSQGRSVAREIDNSSDDHKFSPAPAMSLRLEDDDSSEEETVPVQTPASLHQVGTNVRRLHLEEDDEMDEIERLLLDQSANSMQQRQRQSSRSSRPGAMNDDDEFGESSLQSRDDGSDEFGEVSIRSREDKDVSEVSGADQRSVHQDEETHRQQDHQSSRHHDSDGDDEIGEISRESHDDNDAEFGEDDALIGSPARLNGRSLADSFDEENESEQSSAGIASGHIAEVDITTLEESTSSDEQQIKDNALTDSVASMNKAERTHHDATHTLEDSAADLENDTDLHNDGANELKHFTSNTDNTAVACEEDEDNALEESSSNLASGSREYYSRNSPDRASSRHAYDDPLALQSDDDDTHSDRNVAVASRPNPLESSFDADAQSDLDGEASTELSTQPIKHLDDAEDEWSEEQLLAAERSLDRALVPDVNDEASGNVESLTMALRMEDDESSEEEETMPVQTQPTFSASLNRFGMNTRRLNLEEDDEMDEIERLLLDQSASSMEKRQQQHGRSTRPTAKNDDDAFGESSLQSRDDESEDFVEDSIRSREGNEFKGVLARSQDNEFDGRPVHHNESSTSADSETLSAECCEDNAVFQLSSAVRRSELSESRDEANSFDESATNLESVKAQRLHEENESGRSSYSFDRDADALADSFHEDNELEQSAASIASVDQADEIDALEEVAEHTRGGGHANDTVEYASEESPSSLLTRSRGQYSTKTFERVSRTRSYDDPLALQSGDDDIGTDRRAVIYRPTPLESSFDADIQSDIGDDHGADVQLGLRLEDDGSSEEETMSVQTQPTYSASLSRLGVGSRRLNLEEDDEMDEIERLLLDQSAPSVQERQQQSSRSSRPATTGDDDEFGEPSLRAQGDDDDEFGVVSIGLHKDYDLTHTSTRARDNTFGVQSTRSNETRQQQPAPFTGPDVTGHDDAVGDFSRRSHGDDVEFDEASIRSRSQEEDEFGETSIRSRSHGEDEFGEASITSHHDKPIEASNNSRLDEGGRLQTSMPSDLRKTNELSQALSSLRGERQLGEPTFRSREDDEFSEVSARSKVREDEEIGEVSIRSGSYEEDDFGEMSIPLQDDAGIPPAPSRLPNVRDVEHFTQSPTFTNSGMIYLEGMMNSPVKLSTAAARDDSASEAEQDYMDDSFDLDESLEEEEDDGERDV